MHDIPDPPWKAGTLIKHPWDKQYGVVIESFYFDDKDAKLHDEKWLIHVLVDEEIVEGWEFDWEDWILINNSLR
jgi:hypothetical protein